MHTYNGRDVIIHHNQDLSGEIRIINKHTEKSTTISKYDLLNFVAREYVLPKRISELEDMDAEDILK